jgi:hypothetical protein
MCATDLDLDPEIAEIVQIAEDEGAPCLGQPGLGQPGLGQQGPGPHPDGGQAPGVAWGRAEPHPAAK